MSERKAVYDAWQNTRDAAAERRLDAKIEKHFKSHRDVPNGRNFVFWEHDNDPVARRKYRENFDKIFPNAPGAGI